MLIKEELKEVRRLGKHFLIVFSMLSIIFTATVFQGVQTIWIPIVYLLITICTIYANVSLANFALKKNVFRKENVVFSTLALIQVAFTLFLYMIFAYVGLS